MTARLDYLQTAPDAVKAVYQLETYVQTKTGLDPSLIHLVKLRASIVNGCAYCVDMHVNEARKDGLSEQWISLVSVWKEAQVFTVRERAALRWTDAVTLVGETGVPDEDYAAVKEHFSDTDIVNMTVAIGTINLWNRLAVSFRAPHPIDNAA